MIACRIVWMHVVPYRLAGERLGVSTFICKWQLPKALPGAASPWGSCLTCFSILYILDRTLSRVGLECRGPHCQCSANHGCFYAITRGNADVGIKREIAGARCDLSATRSTLAVECGLYVLLYVLLYTTCFGFIIARQRPLKVHVLI